MNKISPAGPEDAKAKKNKAYRKRMSRTQSVYLFLKNSAQRAAENRNCIGKWVGGGICCIGTVVALSVLIIGIVAGSMAVAVPDLITGCYCNKMEGLTAPEIPQAFKVDTSCPKYGNYDMTPYHTDNFTDIIIHPRGEEDVNIAAYYYPGDPSRNVAGETIILTPGFGASRTKYTLLLPARILQQLGFNVVSIDTRSHGESDAYMDRKTTWGYLEHKDTLGAWDWAVQNLAGGDTSRVGLMGASLGGCISKIAFGTERRVPGLFLDSPAYSLQRALEHRMAALYLPTALYIRSTMHFAEEAVNVEIRHRQPPNMLKDASQSYYDPDSRRKIAVISGLEDTSVPWEMHGEKFLEMASNYGYNITHVWTESTLDEGELCKGCSSFPYVRTGFDASECWDGDPENEHVRQMVKFTGTYRRLLCKFWSDVLNRDEALCGLERYVNETRSTNFII